MTWTIKILYSVDRITRLHAQLQQLRSLHIYLPLGRNALEIVYAPEDAAQRGLTQYGDKMPLFLHIA